MMTNRNKKLGFSERRQLIYELYTKEGKTTTEIAAIVSMTRARVRDIVNIMQQRHDLERCTRPGHEQSQDAGA
jgi:DNA-directed RNA polymerase specialized sigma subunit